MFTKNSTAGYQIELIISQRGYLCLFTGCISFGITSEIERLPIEINTKSSTIPGSVDVTEKPQEKITALI